MELGHFWQEYSIAMGKTTIVLCHVIMGLRQSDKLVIYHHLHNCREFPMHVNVVLQRGIPWRKTNFNKIFVYNIAIQATRQMGEDKEAVGLSRVHMN